MTSRSVLRRAGLGRSSGRPKLRYYYHVTKKDRVPSILATGLRPSDGVCGNAVYLWRDEQHAFEYMYANDDVCLRIGTTRVSDDCEEEDYEKEGDSDFYENVALMRIGTGKRWRPATIKVIAEGSYWGDTLEYVAEGLDER